MSQNTRILVRSYIDALAASDRKAADQIRPRLDLQAKLQRQIVDHLATVIATTANGIAQATGRSTPAVIGVLATMELNEAVRRTKHTRPREWVLA